MNPCDATLLAALLVCGLSDIYRGRVYDWVTWPAAGAGLALNSLLAGQLGFGSAVSGFLVGFGFLYLLYLTGRMGGGDVKLMGAVGALKGLTFVYVVLVYSFLIGGLISLLYLIWGPKPQGEQAGPPTIPFGTAICFACLWALAEQLTGRAAVDWLLS